MDTTPLPSILLVLIWLPAVGTGITHAILMMRSGSAYGAAGKWLAMNNEFSLALLIYGIWVTVGGCVLLWALEQHAAGTSWLHIDGGAAAAGLGLATAAACIALWSLVELALRKGGFGMYRVGAVDTSQWARPSPSELVVLGIIGSLLVPMFEEISFRGYLLTATTQLTGSAAAATAIVAVAFAAIHYYYGAGVMLYAAITSTLFSLVTIRYGTLLPAIVAHSLINLWSFVVLPMSRPKRPE